jgi:succinate dehydrogenase / fumarate reductase, membrane anchor subunit
MTDTRLRSPLGRAFGLGSAKEGVDHWWTQRLSALALVPLSLWFVASVLSHLGASYDEFGAWLDNPITAVMMVLTVGVTFFHANSGLQVVIEDYVHVEWTRLVLLILARFACFFLAAAGIVAVLKISFGG